MAIKIIILFKIKIMIMQFFLDIIRERIFYRSPCKYFKYAHQ